MISPEAISISLSDGEENSITIFRAHQPTVLPVLVILPALGVKGSYYRNVAQHFAAHHYHVVTIDHRGHGHSSVRPSQQFRFWLPRANRIGVCRNLQNYQKTFLAKVKL
jgi:predicted alpha/beta hydrolase